MADEFVDLYETLDLPIDTDRNTVRKRINELYTEAQRNLDHRNFQTRVKYQELFEIILPQARYILLDEGRRDQYDALVRSVRAPKTAEGAPLAPPPTTPQESQSSGFKLTGEAGIPGQTPAIEPIPSASMPQITPEQRDEQWQKWKSGLAEVLEREAREEIRPKTKPNVPPPISSSGSGAAEAPPKREAKARPVIKFDFGEDDDNHSNDATEATGDDSKPRVDPKEVERRRTEHRRELMKEILVGEGIKGMAIGAGGVVVVGVIAMLVFMSKFYPRGGTPSFPVAVPETVMWLIWLALIGVGAFFSANAVSKSMRKKRGAELAKLPYDDIVKLGGRPL